jgi:heterodisulfide reductase subunit D
MDQETYAEQIRMCAACPKMCRHVCPTFFAWRSDAPTPHGRAMLLHYAESGTRDLDERAIEVLYQCLECSHCLTWCVPKIDIASIVEFARERIAADGKAPQGLADVTASITQNHNPFREPHESRTSWMPEGPTNSGRVIFFVGCTASYREQEIARDAVELLAFLGFEVIVLDDEWCCGSPLFRTGFVGDALSQARHNVELLNSLDADEIVTVCPGCYRTLTKDYPSHELDLNKPVKHISQILAAAVPSTSILRETKTITFHDPCHLGRHTGEYDAPRDTILKASGQRPVEMLRSRENATCCGNGAGLRVLFPDQAKVIGHSRINDAKEVGAEIIVTSCPFCKGMLEQQSDESIEVLDLTGFVLRMMKSRDTKGD